MPRFRDEDDAYEYYVQKEVDGVEPWASMARARAARRAALLAGERDGAVVDAQPEHTAREQHAAGADARVPGGHEDHG